MKFKKWTKNYTKTKIEKYNVTAPGCQGEVSRGCYCNYNGRV